MHVDVYNRIINFVILGFDKFQCAALYPKADLENKALIALGQLNGTVTVRT